jgi:hypothetical protein
MIVLVVVELECTVFVIVMVVVVVAATVPENTVTAGGVTVLVWTISTVFVSVMIDGAAVTVCTTGLTGKVIVVVSGPSGPSRLTRRARRASLATMSLLRRNFTALVVLADGDETGLDEWVGVEVEAVLMFTFATGVVASIFLALLVHFGTTVDVDVVVVAEWVFMVRILSFVVVDVVFLS